MSIRAVSHRMHLNALPLALLPGLGICGYALDGAAATVEVMALWCAFVCAATGLATRRHCRQRYDVRPPCRSGDVAPRMS